MDGSFLAITAICLGSKASVFRFVLHMWKKKQQQKKIRSKERRGIGLGFVVFEIGPIIFSFALL